MAVCPPVSITCTFWVVFIEIDCKVMRDLQLNGKKRRLLSEKFFQEDLWLNTLDIFFCAKPETFQAFSH